MGNNSVAIGGPTTLLCVCDYVYIQMTHLQKMCTHHTYNIQHERCQAYCQALDLEKKTQNLYSNKILNWRLKGKSLGFVDPGSEKTSKG